MQDLYSTEHFNASFTQVKHVVSLSSSLLQQARLSQSLSEDLINTTYTVNIYLEVCELIHHTHFF